MAEISGSKVAGKGLRLVFLGAVIAAAGGLRVINPWAGGAAGIVGTLLVLYGLYAASPAHPYYKLAMHLECAVVVLSALRMIFRGGLLNDLLSIAGTLAALLSTVFVCSATRGLLKEKDDACLADQARLIILLYALCAVVTILCIVLSWIPILNILAAVTGAITSLVMLAADVLKIWFYFKASRSLTH